MTDTMIVIFAFVVSVSYVSKEGILCRRGLTCWLTVPARKRDVYSMVEFAIFDFGFETSICILGVI